MAYVLNPAATLHQKNCRVTDVFVLINKGESYQIGYSQTISFSLHKCFPIWDLTYFTFIYL